MILTRTWLSMFRLLRHICCQETGKTFVLVAKGVMLFTLI